MIDNREVPGLDFSGYATTQALERPIQERHQEGAGLDTQKPRLLEFLPRSFDISPGLQKGRPDNASRSTLRLLP